MHTFIHWVPLSLSLQDIQVLQKEVHIKPVNDTYFLLGCFPDYFSLFVFGYMFLVSSLSFALNFFLGRWRGTLLQIPDYGSKWPCGGKHVVTFSFRETLLYCFQSNSTRAVHGCTAGMMLAFVHQLLWARFSHAFLFPGRSIDFKRDVPGYHVLLPADEKCV